MEKVKEKFKKHKPTIILLVLIALFLFCTDFYTNIAERLFGGVDNINPKGELFKVTLTVLGAIGGLVVLYFNYRRTKAMENQIGELTKQNEITREGQVDERFKNAIDQLGDKSEAVVLGAIHSLHRIAEESETYRKTVFDILCSYIRQRTPKSDDEEINKKSATFRKSVIFNTIIHLLFRNKKERELYERLSADLSNINLSGANLNFTKLIWANLIDTNLSYADLRGADLSYADLIDTNLSYANLGSADLSHNYSMKIKNLIGTNLSYAKVGIVGGNHSTFFYGILYRRDNDRLLILGLDSVEVFMGYYGKESKNIRTIQITKTEIAKTNKIVKDMLDEWNKPEWKEKRDEIMKEIEAQNNEE